MSRLPVFGCLALLGPLGGLAAPEEVIGGHQFDLEKGSSSDQSNNLLASPSDPNVYAFHAGEWPFSIDFPKPSLLPG